MSKLLSDRFGRRPVILCASLVFLVGAIVMGAAPEKVTLLVGRIIVGVGIGTMLFSVFTEILHFSTLLTLFRVAFLFQIQKICVGIKIRMQMCIERDLFGYILEVHSKYLL